VVDPELRVRASRGCDRRRVRHADVIRGHTNAPSIVIGERAADLMKAAGAAAGRVLDSGAFADDDARAFV